MPAPAAQAALEQALAVASRGSAGIGDLLEALRGARLWLPLPGDGTPPVTGPDLTLPTVTYLGSYFVPAYSSASVLREQAPSAVSLPGGEPPHAVVAAADLARLLPPAVGIALNAGSAASVPVYPQAVSWLAGDTGPAAGRDGITVAPL